MTELVNICERLCVLIDCETVFPEDLPGEVREGTREYSAESTALGVTQPTSVRKRKKRDLSKSVFEES